MANNCYIDLRIKTETTKQAAGLRKELRAAFEQAAREDVGAFFGSECYLFDGHIKQKGTELFIGGWVKWGYGDDEFVEMFNWLRTKVTIKKLNMHYEEWLNELYGEYDFDGETLRNIFLEEKDFPAQTANDCEDFDGYCAKVEAAFQKNRVTRFIPIA